MEVRDVFLGISGEVPAGWIASSDADILSAHDPRTLLAASFASRLDPDSLIRKLLSLIQSSLGVRILNPRIARGNYLEVRGYLPPSQALQLLGLPPGELVVRVHPGSPTRGWFAHESLVTPELERVASSFHPVGSIGARSLRIVDAARGMVAYEAVVPASATVDHRMVGEFPHLDVRGGDYRVILYPPRKFVHGGSFAAQAYLATGYELHPYLDAGTYARTVFSSMGYGVRRVEEAPIPGILAHEVYALLGRSLALGPPAMSSVLAWFDGGVAWVVTMGETFMGAQLWRAYLYLATGRDPLPILQSLVMHVRADMRWLNALNRESNAIYRSVVSSIRSFRPLKLDSGITKSRPGSWSGWDTDKEEGSVWEPGDSWLSEEPSTGTGMDTFYVDSDGSVRDMDLGEEISFPEVDAEGVLRDGEGNEVGYVEDGYVYDSEGNRLGWLDTSISDEWQMERLESESSDSSSVFGYYDWGAQSNEESTETPYYSSKLWSGEEEEEE